MSGRPIPPFSEVLDLAIARLELPSSESLVKTLAPASVLLEEGKDREAAIAIVRAVTDILYDALEPGHRGVLRPLLRVVQAFEALDDGEVEPMMEPVPRSGRPRERSRVRYLKGLGGLALAARLQRSEDATIRVVADRVCRDLAARGVVLKRRDLMDARRQIEADAVALGRREPSTRDHNRLRLAVALRQSREERAVALREGRAYHEPWTIDYAMLLTYIVAEARSQGLAEEV